MAASKTLTPEQLSARGRTAVRASWDRTQDRTARTRAGTEASVAARQKPEAVVARRVRKLEKAIRAVLDADPAPSAEERLRLAAILAPGSGDR